MTFDARSKERLEALGRSLPKKLPTPVPAKLPLNGTSGAEGGRVREGGRHHLEREEDPAALFRALMKASPDGSVPPHLLERLRELEGAGGAAPREEASPGTPVRAPRGATAQRTTRQNLRGDKGPADRDLYTAFTQLLLEEEDSL